jgi:hypothetical protein|tara:strand:- start:103 stop:366 length:264 start_codon:yes stop_codon:yes gene_type:complete
MSLEKCFNQFRENIVGIYQKIQSSYGEQDLIYKDWIPTGRLYYPEKNKTLYKLVLSKQIDTQKWLLLVLYILTSSLVLGLVKECFSF